LDESNEDLESDNILNNERTASDEMCVIPNIYSEDQNLLNIAPAQNKLPPFFLMTFVKNKRFLIYYQKENLDIKLVGMLNFPQSNISFYK